MQRRAQQKLTDERLSQKIERLKKNFNALHSISARREEGVMLLDEIETILESNAENESIQEIESIKNAIQNLRRSYKLDQDMSMAIDDYLGFQKGLERIKYAGLIASQEKQVHRSIKRELEKPETSSAGAPKSFDTEEEEMSTPEKEGDSAVNAAQNSNSVEEVSKPSESGRTKRKTSSRKS